MRWIISVVLLIVAGMITFVNAAIARRWLSTARRGSLVPVIGGILGSLGLLLIPLDGLSAYWWIPLLA
ncbi:MAG: hypothetical protein ACRD4F_19190, partial [Candidatus Angelobacter sp.]